MSNSSAQTSTAPANPTTSAARNRGSRASRRNSPAHADRRSQRQRSQRAAWACERCRLKKLRCVGGHPCAACQRAEAECDFGDGGSSGDHTSSLTSQRLLQLEKTVVDLVASLNRRTHPPYSDASSQPPGPLTSPLPSLAQTAPFAPSDLTGPSYHGSTAELPAIMSRVQRSPAALSQANTVPASSYAVPGSLPRPRSQAMNATTPLSTSSVPEELGSRWIALQHNAAPFPPLMGHPAIWTEDAAGASPQGEQEERPTIGPTSYRANVGLNSEPVSERIIDEASAKALFSLFVRKCHPSSPLLDSSSDEDGHFNHVRASSPFLFTAILAVAGRYRTSYRNMQQTTSNLPPISDSAFDALADLAYAHLGFALFRKQHRLFDIQATMLLSVWIPRGNGQAADQWVTMGLCNRLAYRIGIPDACRSPAILNFTGSHQLEAGNIQEIRIALSRWYTWLNVTQYETFLSLGFGRPLTNQTIDPVPRQFLNTVRRLGLAAQVDLKAATYVTSLAELSPIATDLISGLKTSRSRTTSGQDSAQPSGTTWQRTLTLLSKLNPRLDEWQRQWTWDGSYDTIALDHYATLVKIYGEHTRLCLNSLSLNLVMTSPGNESRQNQLIVSSLGRACDAAVALVKHYCPTPGAESVVAYGGEYLVLILGQAAMFIVRLLVARLSQLLPVDPSVLVHYLKRAIEVLESSNISATNICAWMAQLCSGLASHAGVVLAPDGDVTDANMARKDTDLPELEWDFDLSAILAQDGPIGGTGLDLGHYFDFSM